MPATIHPLPGITPAPPPPVSPWSVIFAKVDADSAMIAAELQQLAAQP